MSLHNSSDKIERNQKWIFYKLVSTARECGARKGQAKKSARGMPWHQEPKKDVAIYDKPRLAESRHLTRGFPNGETRLTAMLVTVH